MKTNNNTKFMPLRLAAFMLVSKNFLSKLFNSLFKQNMIMYYLIKRQISASYSNRPRKMNCLTLFFCCLSYTLSMAQIIVNPVFDRTDNYKFRVNKVEIAKDTTRVYCTYSADEYSWANISKNTYLESVRNGKKYPIIKVAGLPFSPDKKHFTCAEEIPVILYFPHIVSDKISIIESESEEAFNIYGIDLNSSYDTSYTAEDIYNYYCSAEKKEEEMDWRTATQYFLKQLEASNYVEGRKSFASACSMYNLTMTFSNLEDYGKVIEWGKKAIDILRVLPQDSVYLDFLARAYGNVGTAYYVLKKPDMATEYMELSLATRRLKEGVGRLNYEEYLSKMAAKYYYEENYPRAMLYGRETVDIYEKKYSENPYMYQCVYLYSLINLCGYYQSMTKLNEAVSIGKRALELSEKGVCDDDVLLKFAIYNSLGGALVNDGKIDEGICLLETALTAAKKDNLNNEEGILSSRLQLASAYLYYKNDTLRALNEYQTILKQIEDSMSVGKKDYLAYPIVLEKMYEIYRWNNPDIAMLYLNKAINVQKEWNGDKSIAYANLLLDKIKNIWVEALAEKNNTDSLLLFVNQSSEIIKRHINNSAYNMSRSERHLYWQKYEDFFTWLIPTINSILNSDESNSLAYNAALFNKGMLLSSEKEFRDVILSSNDESLIELYKVYVNNLSFLEEQYGYKSSEKIDSLNKLIQENEYLLSQKTTRLNKLFKGNNFTWKDVRDHLKDGDVAFEIVSFENLGGSIDYYAYAISPKCDSPQQIAFCDENTLKDLFYADSIDYKTISSIIWGNQRLNEIMQGAKNIYFSASGLLNIIGIEYLPISNEQYIFDKYNIFRLSSTRELCYNRQFTEPQKVCLFGGLDYNNSTDIDVINDEHKMALLRSVTDSIVRRGGFDPLPGSKMEIDQIRDEIVQNHLACDVFTNSDGTEWAFKNISSTPVDIIHLSTHGMYIPNENDNLRKNNKLSFFLSGESTGVDEETQSLSHSFLVMSGGNKIMFKDSVLNSREDGILTALEVSHLDFSNLDMVVLSACQTALGLIESDGVYGLQRGFKKAGANTILMSLDKVDDEATRILMVEFYRNLMNGKTKHQSLMEAQQHLRHVENGKYDDPKYWASFIMLDGLN